MANEKRLVNVEKLMENAKWYEGFSAELDSEISLHYISVEDLKSAPAVDAVEVVHGEWEIIEDDYFDLVELKCSACGESFGFEDYEDCIPQNYHYCPNCGANMMDLKGE